MYLILNVVCVMTKIANFNVCETSKCKNSMFVGSQGYICAKNIIYKIQAFISSTSLTIIHLSQKRWKQTKKNEEMSKGKGIAIQKTSSKNKTTKKRNKNIQSNIERNF